MHGLVAAVLAEANYGKALADWLFSNLKPLWIVAVVACVLANFAHSLRKPAVWAAMFAALMISGLPIFAPHTVEKLPNQAGQVLDKAAK
jgi:hypothetical protein